MMMILSSSTDRKRRYSVYIYLYMLQLVSVTIIIDLLFLSCRTTAIYSVVTWSFARSCHLSYDHIILIHFYVSFLSFLYN